MPVTQAKAQDASSFNMLRHKMPKAKYILTCILYYAEAQDAPSKCIFTCIIYYAEAQDVTSKCILIIMH
ncbi:MAG: hypothetical protein A6F71_07550 [Cycloclasticus sp. symbiont of Poecilosclerida sp. M]|nr:MAG: hypothetical protein A6F71_07550 [Cycloclasticus sp. symbiont of Poecilosclerida sp. M]